MNAVRVLDNKCTVRGDGILTEKAGVVKLNLEAHIPQGDRCKCDTSPLLKKSLTSKHRNVVAVTDFDPVKRLVSMALETAPCTDKVCKKTLPTPEFGHSNLVTSDTIWTFLCSSEIGPSRPTRHLIEVALSMEFLPDNVWTFLEWVSAFRCNEDTVMNLPKHDFVSSSEAVTHVEPRYRP